VESNTWKKLEKKYCNKFPGVSIPTSIYVYVNLCCETTVLHLVFEAAYSGDDNGYKLVLHMRLLLWSRKYSK
jgi:hypothetical protein